jgi:hypothetical protein
MSADSCCTHGTISAVSASPFVGSWVRGFVGSWVRAMLPPIPRRDAPGFPEVPELPAAGGER